MIEADAHKTWKAAIDAPALILFAALAGVVFLQFFTRYVLNDSLGWTEEIARYLLICVAYAGSITAIRKGGHIFLEATYRYMPLSNVKPLALFVEFLNVVYHSVLAGLAALLALNTDQRMVAVDVPKSLIYAVIAVCLCFAAIFAAQRLLSRYRQSGQEILDEIESAATRDAQA